ncbi:MAG: exosortase K [Myxococcales bacterium]|nr:exosortase K [Myxococcales bacterium]
MSSSAQNMRKNILLFSFCLVFFYLGKEWYRQASPSAMYWLLWPTSQLVSLFSGMGYLYQPLEGFLREDGAILIHKDCSGFNFFLMSLMVTFTFSFRSHLGARRIALLLLGGIFASYFATILANTSRILCATQLLSPAFSGFLSPQLAHKSIGIFVYLSFLITFSLILWRLTYERPQQA